MSGGGGQHTPGTPSPAGRGGCPLGQRWGETPPPPPEEERARVGGLVARAGRLWRWSGLGGGGVCVCACFRGRVVGSTGGSWGSSGRAGASGLARPDPAAPQPSHAGGQPPGSCCLVDRSSRGSLVLSRRPPCHAGCGLCPRAALPFRIRTNRVLCQGAQRAPARGSPVFCWAGEGVFHSPVVSINDLVFLWWCSVFWPSPSPHRSSVL